MGVFTLSCDSSVRLKNKNTEKWKSTHKKKLNSPTVLTVQSWMAFYLPTKAAERSGGFAFFAMIVFNAAEVLPQP